MQSRNVVPSGHRPVAPRVFMLAAITIMSLINNNIRCDSTNQSGSHQSSTCLSLNVTNQAHDKVENSKQNSPSTKVLCQTTFSPPIVHVNNDSSIQLASTLEPVYFGTYPITSKHNLDSPRIQQRFPQQTASTNNFFAAHTLIGPPNSSPEIGSSFYQPKEPPDIRDVADDLIAKPIFEHDLSVDPGTGDGQIVTLQAFGSEVSDANGPRGSGETQLGPQAEDATGRSKYHADLMRILRKLPTSKQVQLINSFSSTSSLPLERPSLNLVSGSMRVSAPALSQMVTIGHPKNSEPSDQDQLLELLARLKATNGSPETSLDQHEMYRQQMYPIDDLEQDAKLVNSKNMIREDDKEFLNNLLRSLNIPQDEKDSSSASSQANEAANEQQTVPIARLVDHLMENSRLSTFGVQHGDGIPELPDEEEEASELNPSEEEDEEEEDEEEPENEATEEAQESSLVQQKRLSPMMQGFSAVLNQSSSWIPLDTLDGMKRSSDLLQGKKRKRKDGTTGKKDEPKKKNLKRKRKKRRKKRVVGLIVGDKVFSNADLVRLIEILNKLASKGKTKAERESSKKLLKYLIKLMLDEYKKNSSFLGESSVKMPLAEKKDDSNIKLKEDSAGSIRDLLRPHLESPTTIKDDEPTRAAIVTPLQDNPPKNESTAKPMEKESQKAEKVEEKRPPVSSFIEGNKSNRGDEDKKNRGKNETNLSHGLDKLTEDLEHYFDSDFYEDLADDMDRNKSHISLASGLVGTRLTRVPRHRIRPPRLIYTVPVPIYRQQLFEAADEEDTDFDAVTIPVPKRRPPPISTRRRSPARRPLMRRRPKKRRLAVEEQEVPEQTEPEEEEEEEEPEKEEESDRTPSEKASGASEQPVAASLEVPHAEPVESEAETEHEQELEAEPKQANPVELEYIQEPKSSVGQQDEPPVRRRRRKRRRRKAAVAGRGARKDVDYESRYEIPAPIGATSKSLASFHNSSTTPQRNQPSRRVVPKTRQQSSKPEHSYGKRLEFPHRKVAASSKKILRRVKPKSPSKIPKPTIERHRRTHATNNGTKPIRLSRRRKPPPSKADPDEPVTGDPGPGEADEDYYNDSSSYTKICDDDNKCEVKVHKSGPKKSYRKSEMYK